MIFLTDYTLNTIENEKRVGGVVKKMGKMILSFATAKLIRQAANMNNWITD